MEAVRNYIQDSSFKNGYKNNLGMLMQTGASIMDLLMTFKDTL